MSEFLQPLSKLLQPIICSTVSLCVLLLSLSACGQQVDWVTYRGEGGSGATSNALYPPLGQRWKLRLQFKGDRARAFNSPIVRGDTIYFGSGDKNFYALDSRSGYMRWIFPAKNAVNSVPFAYQDSIYFGSNDGHVYAVNINDGSEEWSFQTGKTVQSLIYRYQDRIIFTSDAGATFFLDPQGNLVDRLPNPVWSHHTFQVYEGIVYWAPLQRGFGAYDMHSRRFLWDVKVQVNSPVWYSFPAIDDNRVYFASSFLTNRPGEAILFTYYALDRLSGRQVWRKQEPIDWSPFIEKNYNNGFFRHIDLLDYMAPSLWKDLVIYTSGDTTVRAFDRRNGELVWKQKFDLPTSSAPTIAGGRIYFGVRGAAALGRPPRLVALAASDGRLLWEMELEGAVLSAPVVSGRQMLFGTDQNLFYVLEETLW